MDDETVVALVIVGEVGDEATQAISDFFKRHGFGADEVERENDGVLGPTVSFLFRGAGNIDAVREHLCPVLNEHLDSAMVCGAIAS